MPNEYILPNNKTRISIILNTGYDTIAKSITNGLISSPMFHHNCYLQMILRSILALTGLSTPFAASQMYVPLSCRLTFGSDSRLPELCFSPEGSIWYCKTKAKHTINFIIHCCFSSSI